VRLYRFFLAKARPDEMIQLVRPKEMAQKQKV
jgi:hypothetical protein